MWLLFHRNAKTRPVRDGHTFVETCPACHQRARFVEVEIEENFGVWFVDVVGDKERAYRCSACCETFDLKDDDAAAGAAQPAAKPARPAVAVRTDEEIAAEKAAREIRLDDELAALKKRMGK
jgi:hypothetical protein